VVVVFPLVPDTMAMRFPTSSLLNALESSFSITLPRIDAPVPRPASREAAPAKRPAYVAADSRAVEMDMALIRRGTGSRSSSLQRRSFPDSFPFLGPAPGVSDGTRTRDILDHNQVLYQLSYTHHASGPNGFADHCCAA
jgi:hypothetical protein